uniref:1-alkyl-2-acetylglycerophosphocholine esterase n=1 Tax=Plectus sambesii TaxID=2011161 RepID=A0A914UZI5_9BILA
VVAVEHRDRSACWTYTLEKDAEGNYQEKPIIMRQLEPDEKEFKLRNPQLHKRVSECVKALHLMEEMNLGQCGSAEQKLRGSKIILGQDFDWTQFKGRLDISRAAVAGHSFGGATAIASTAISNDFQAAVVLDGWMMPIEWDLYAKAQQPLLFINAGVWQWTDNVKRMLKFDKLVAERLMVTFRNVVHQSFTDFTYPCKGFVGKKMGFQGETE